MEIRTENGHEGGQAKPTCPFHTWCVVEWALDPAYAQNLEWDMGKLLRDANIPFPSREDADRLAKIVMTSADSKSTKRNKLRALELYMEWLGHPDVKFRKPVARRKLPKYLTEDEMKMLLRAARNWRDYAILALFMATGMRLNELTGLDVGDVDFTRKMVTVRTAKFDKEREIDLNDETLSILRSYLEKYHGMKADVSKGASNRPLFMSMRGTRISNKAVGTMVKKAGERAGLRIEISPHVLRHSFATTMLANGCDIFQLSRILGHASIAITEPYLHVNNDYRRNAYNKGVPKIF